MPRFYLTFWVVLLCFLTDVYGQDPQFSQFYANPLAQNPAFTGNARMGRVIVNYRKQAYGLNRDFETMAASYDTYLENTDSRSGQPSLGLGLQLMRDKQGAGTFLGSTEGLYTTSAYLSASKRLARFGTDGKYKCWSGMQIGGVSRLIRGQSLLFADQFSGSGVSPSSMEPVALANGITRNFFDVNAGLLFEVDPQENVALYDRTETMYWVGGAIHHLNKSLPKDPWLPLSQRVSLQAGLTIPFARVLSLERGHTPTPYRVRTHTLAANVRQQAGLAQLDFGYNWRYSPLMLGAWVRGIPLNKVSKNFQQNALVFLVGIQPTDFPFQLELSYDFPLSTFRGYSGGAYELSLWMGLEKLGMSTQRFRQFKFPTL